jgi:CheY-like chemotaxis protein
LRVTEFRELRWCKIACVASILAGHRPTKGRSARGTDPCDSTRLDIASCNNQRTFTSSVMHLPDALPSILVVDDDQDIREILAIVLQRQGCEVIVASDGAHALELLRNGSACPAVILLDLRMPIMNGWQFREEQLRDPRLASIPVVVMTGDRSQAAREGLPGTAGFLAKPLELQELRALVSRFTGPS